MSEDKGKPTPQLPKPDQCPKPEGGKVKEYGDGASTVVIESDKD